MEGEKRRYVGIDLGKRTMEVHFIDSKGKHETWSCKTDIEGRMRLVRRLRAQDTIGIEACPLAFILDTMIREDVGAKVHVLNPRGLALIYRSTKKTDREDAAKLAWVVQRLPEGELPTVKVPSADEQELRSLVSEQVALTQRRTREINRLHALFVQDGITTVRKKDLRTEAAREGQYQALSVGLKSRALRFERMIRAYEENLQEVEIRIRELVGRHELSPYLMSIPGVGPNLVAAFLGYLGDGKRFKRETVTAYAGLVPRVDCSGDQNRYGNITKTGCSVLRRAMVQGAWGLSRSVDGGVLGVKYREWVVRKGKSKAAVALARKLLETMWILATRKAMYLGYDAVKFNVKLAKYGVVYNGAVGTS